MSGVRYFGDSGGNCRISTGFQRIRLDGPRGAFRHRSLDQNWFPVEGTRSVLRGPPSRRSFITYQVFTTCPPKRVLIVGDSVALTMGIQMSLNQEDWGTLIFNASFNGCGFVTGYSVVALGKVTSMNPICDHEITLWAKDARIFKPQVIVVELGWWDSFQHLINGQITSLSQLPYDYMVEQQIHGLIDGLRSASPAPIYFLSVPWMNSGPAPQWAARTSRLSRLSLPNQLTAPGRYALLEGGSICGHIAIHNSFRERMKLTSMAEYVGRVTASASTSRARNAPYVQTSAERLFSGGSFP